MYFLHFFRVKSHGYHYLQKIVFALLFLSNLLWGSKSVNAQAPAPLVQVNPGEIKVSVRAPEFTIEGTDSEPFSVSVTPPGVPITSYKWVWKASAVGNPGNDPSVSFATPTEKTTIVSKSHWFASPNSSWINDTSASCTYLVNCEVEIRGKTYKDQNNNGDGVSFVVHVAVDDAKTAPPYIKGSPSVELRTVDGATRWYVKDIGSLVRVAPEITLGHDPLGKLPMTSEFYKKIVNVHEKQHIIQMTTGVPGLTLHTLWDPVALFNNTLKNLFPRLRKEDLLDDIQTEIDDQNDRDNRTYLGQKPAAEDDANTQSNAATPLYLNNKIPYDQ